MEGNTQEGEQKGNAQEGEQNSNAQEGEQNSNAQEGEQNGNAQEGEQNSNAQEGEQNGNAQEGEQNSNAQEGEQNGNAQEGEQKGNSQVPTPLPLLFNFVLLRTTPELYAALTEAFLDKSLVYDPHKGMVFDPQGSPEYTTHVCTFKHSGRMITTTVPDGNCLFHSLSKALLGTEKYHYRIRTRLLGFVYANSKIHIQQRCQSQVEFKSKNTAYISMDHSGIWGTEIKILAAATLLQAPMYTYTQTQTQTPITISISLCHLRTHLTCVTKPHWPHLSLYVGKQLTALFHTQPLFSTLLLVYYFSVAPTINFTLKPSPALEVPGHGHLLGLACEHETWVNPTKLQSWPLWPFCCF